MPQLKKSRFTVDTPVKHNGERGLALYQTMTEAFILVPESDWSDIIGDRFRSTDPATIDMLCEQGFLVAEEVDEKVLFDYWKQQHVHDFNTIRSKVLVTRKCNNRCRYCIIDPEAKEMTSEAAQAMDQFYIEVIKARHPQRVEDDYLGGEPLLNTRVIKESAARRFYYCMGKGIEYGFTMTTNGTLLKPALISEMKRIGLTGIRVSLAGPAPIHDRLRPSKNNGKTYEVIMKNLQAVSDQVPINIECQYDSSTLDYQQMPDMMDDMIAQQIHIKDIAFTPILARRGKTEYGSGTGDPKIFRYLIQEARKRGYLKEGEAPSMLCMADFRSRFVFDTDGSIIPCPSLQGGERAYGHVSQGIDFVLEAQLRQRRLPDKCLEECALLPLCMGGCRLQALVHQQDFNGIDCHYDSYRFFLEEYIRERASAVLDLQQEGPVHLKKAA